MIDNLIMLFKLVIVSLPIILLCLLSRRVNLSRSERCKQMPMPVITMVYSIVAMVLLSVTFIML